MVSTRSADVAFPLIGKPIDRLSSLRRSCSLVAKSCRGFYSWIHLLPKCKFYQDQNQYVLGRIQDNASLGKKEF